MQEDFKNQLQNTLGLWRKRGQGRLSHLLRNTKGELLQKLAQQGIAERWPALVNLLEEILPEITPSIASIVGRKAEPLADWLDIKVNRWEPNRLELNVTPQNHLIDRHVWKTSTVVAMSELALRWLIEKLAPPGDLQIRVTKLELEAVTPGLSACLVRTEIEPMELERAMAQLLKNQKVEMMMSVMIFSKIDVLLSQTHFHFELHWSPLLK